MKTPATTRLLLAGLGCTLALHTTACGHRGVDVIVDDDDTIAEGEGEDEVAAEGEGEGAASSEGEGEGDSAPGIGTFDDPIVVDAFPFRDARDTTQAPGPALDAYACSPANEGGDAFVYRVVLAQRGLLRAQVGDDAAAGIDVDVHLLTDATADSCVTRANTDLSAVLDAGSYFLVVDTYVQGTAAQAGPYTLDVDVSPLDAGPCALAPRAVKMVWTSCGGVPGCEERADGVYVNTPTTGPVVKEAHLVTDADGFGTGWPSSSTERIAEHHQRTLLATDYAMTRTEPWAPAGEGGSQFGQGSTGNKVPVVDEAWYVNMYWRDKPTPGTRMIITNPATGAAVVASAGWETGPGDNADLGGVTEEIHDALGSVHGTTLLFGFAADQTLPLGPIVCE